MLIIICFIWVHMNHSRSKILVPFSISVALSKIAHLLFATAFDSHLLISIALHCAFAITCTFVDYCTSTCTFIDSCTSTSMTFSSFVSFYVVCSYTKCCSIASSSFDSSMNIGSIDVILGHVCFLTHQLLLLLCKNSTTNVPILYIS
jgi:hypothetical protein